MKNRYTFLILFAFLIGIFAAFFYIKSKETKPLKIQIPPSSKNDLSERTRKLFIGKIPINIEVSDTPELMEKGLSGRENLESDSGMLFVFKSYTNTYFWMKDMKFPLDMIWIRDDKIIDISKNVPIPKPDTPLNQLPKYSPKEKVNYVLEVNAGFTEKNDIKIGDGVTINF